MRCEESARRKNERASRQFDLASERRESASRTSLPARSVAAHTG